MSTANRITRHTFALNGYIGVGGTAPPRVSSVHIVRSGGIAGLIEDRGEHSVPSELEESSYLVEDFRALPTYDNEGIEVRDGFDISVTINYDDGTSHTVSRHEDSLTIRRIVEFLARHSKNER
jgi:hypothetical protein